MAVARSFRLSLMTAFVIYGAAGCASIAPTAAVTPIPKQTTSLSPDDYDKYVVAVIMSWGAVYAPQITQDHMEKYFEFDIIERKRLGSQLSSSPPTRDAIHFWCQISDAEVSTIQAIIDKYLLSTGHVPKHYLTNIEYANMRKSLTMIPQQSITQARLSVETAARTEIRRQLAIIEHPSPPPNYTGTGIGVGAGSAASSAVANDQLQQWDDAMEGAAEAQEEFDRMLNEQRQREIEDEQLRQQEEMQHIEEQNDFIRRQQEEE